MTNDIKIATCIICDIARKELGGKDTLLGVYSDSMSVSVLPAILPSFAIWIELQSSITSFDALQLSILDPDNKPIIKAKGKLLISSQNDSIETKNYSTGIPMQFSNVNFAKAGKYTINIGIDGPMKKIKEFFIYGPEEPKIKKQKTKK